MEFVRSEEIADLLRECQIEQDADGDDCVFLRMSDEGARVRTHVASSDSTAEPLNGAQVVAADRERLANVVDHIIHLLHTDQLVLVPVGKWRRVFDAVAFSLAENEDWQEFDATATVELNTRDPLLCGAADFPTIVALVAALFSDADQPNQGLHVLTTSAPVLLEIVPDGAIRLSMGNEVLADELAEAFAS